MGSREYGEMRRWGDEGDEGDEGEELITNAPCPMPHAQCPMPHAQSPTSNISKEIGGLVHIIWYF